ncbi:MAG TPA: hypothetical protein VK009_20765 [Chloroflexota bacterium]|nr:hypothetical protein [Chloroflexota bacterium]
MTEGDLISALVDALRQLPDTSWQQAAKRRLLQAYDQQHRQAPGPRQWAVYVSAEADASAVANAIVARGDSWRPVAVAPERMAAAVCAIRPALVVVDERLPHSTQLVEDLRHSAGLAVITDAELTRAA